jgi:hypothetical protein
VGQLSQSFQNNITRHSVQKRPMPLKTLGELNHQEADNKTGTPSQALRHRHLKLTGGHRRVAYRNRKWSDLSIVDILTDNMHRNILQTPEDHPMDSTPRHLLLSAKVPVNRRLRASLMRLTSNSIILHSRDLKLDHGPCLRGVCRVFLPQELLSVLLNPTSEVVPRRSRKWA